MSSRPQGKYVGQLTAQTLRPVGSNSSATPYGPPGSARRRHRHRGRLGRLPLRHRRRQQGDRRLQPRPVEPTVSYGPSTNPTSPGGRSTPRSTRTAAETITSCHIDYGPSNRDIHLRIVPCSPDPRGGLHRPTDVHADISGLTSETTYHYRLVVGNANATRVGRTARFTPHKVIGLRADPATAITSSAATLNGSFVGNGTATHYCFE